jgi:hypothetical protein
MFLDSRLLPVRKADNLTAICEAIVYCCGILDISQPYRPPRPVTGLDLLHKDGSLVAKALCCEPESRGFDSR